MIQKVLSHYHLPLLACTGLILFMLVFTTALIWVFRRGSATFYSVIERLPFQDVEPTPREIIEHVKR